MFYTRVALKVDEAADWQWKSPMFTSLTTLFEFLKYYSRLAKDRLRVFFASSGEILNEMLERENSGRVSNSLTVEQFWQQKGRIDRAEILLLETELAMSRSRQLVAATAERPEYGRSTRPLEVLPFSIPVDKTYDSAYVFTLPASMREALVWATLLAKVQRGELVP
jgi:hypothetical protein